MTDAAIWQALRLMADRLRGFVNDHDSVIDAVADETAVPRDRVAQVYLERTFQAGAG